MTSTLRVNTIQNTNTSTLITQTNATTITLGYSSATIAIASGATQTGFGRTGTVDWDTTPKTTTVTAVSGVGYFVNTTSGAITVNLPVGVAGAIVSISDYANTAATNNIIVTPNGTDKIDGVNGIYPFATNGASITFVYVDSTRGWKDVGDATLNAAGIPPFVAATGGTILTCGDFKTHVFTGPGTFTVTNAGGSAGSNSVEYLIVAGGAGGGARYGGGGGAGGFRQNYPSPETAGLPVTAQAYPITVGGGGNGGNSPRFGVSGNPSIFSTITSAGGGGGGGEAPAPTGGLTGGSGGGGAYNGPGGAGNTPPVSPPQGNTGGNGGQIAPTVSFGGGGGGGAAAVGAKAVAGGGGAGGIGSPIATTVFGPTSPSYGTAGPAPGRYFAGGGGGGGGQEGGASGGAGGSGGGGAGGPSSNPGTPATVNTGGGGGGGFGASCTRTGGNGGSGIVVIRYKFQ